MNEGFVAWKRDESRYFGDPDARAEVLHNPWPADAPFALVETSYFGFSIPEHDVRCEIYHVARPKFGLVSGGIIIYRGNQFTTMDSEYLNYFNFMPLQENITDCTYASGVTVKMVKPGEFNISYDDAKAGVSLRLHTKASMPYAYRPKGGHFTQGMKNTGTLVLKGKTYKIDSYSSRDRSWGDPRVEDRNNIPQVGWHCAVFDDNLAFHLIAFNSADRDPETAKKYPWLNKEQGHYIWGYVWKDGELLGIKSCSHLLSVDRDGIAPLKVEFDIVDERGQSYHLEGKVKARLPLPTWPNCIIYFCMAEWTYNGRTTYGEVQTGVYQDFVNENRKPL